MRRALPGDRRGLGQDGDAPLPLLVVGVHDPVDEVLVGAEHARAAEQGVDQGGLAVVDVRHEGDVAEGGDGRHSRALQGGRGRAPGIGRHRGGAGAGGRGTGGGVSPRAPRRPGRPRPGTSSAWSWPGSAPHSGQERSLALSAISSYEGSVVRFSARASSKRRCRPFFNGPSPAFGRVVIQATSVPIGPQAPASPLSVALRVRSAPNDRSGRRAAPVRTVRPRVGSAAVTPAPPPGDARPWWQGAVVYQIYPRSFADANG